MIIAGTEIPPGTRVQLSLPVAKLYADIDIECPIEVIRSKKPGPVVFVSAAIHGNELNGIEIVRRIARRKNLQLRAGTLILVPMVNVYGVLNQTRYMPDRRDLNREFPGSATGSLASRVAYIFYNEIVKQCDYGIDLHTGAIHRSNLPQVRANLDDEETHMLAEAFEVPVVLHSNLRDGSLRQAGYESNTKILVYEAGEALRFDEVSIGAGVRGVINILKKLEMIKTKPKRKKIIPYTAHKSHWLRATSSGIVENLKQLGDAVQKGEALANIGTPLGDVESTVVSQKAGIIIGYQNIPLVHEGDAMFHIAYFKDDDDDVVENIENLVDEFGPTFE